MCYQRNKKISQRQNLQINDQGKRLADKKIKSENLKNIQIK